MTKACTLLNVHTYADDRFTIQHRTFCHFAVLMKWKFWMQQCSSILSAYKYCEQIHTNISVNIQSEKTSLRLACEHIRPVLGERCCRQGRALGCGAHCLLRWHSVQRAVWWRCAEGSKRFQTGFSKLRGIYFITFIKNRSDVCFKNSSLILH